MLADWAWDFVVCGCGDPVMCTSEESLQLLLPAVPCQTQQVWRTMNLDHLNSSQEDAAVRVSEYSRLYENLPDGKYDHRMRSTARLVVRIRCSLRSKSAAVLSSKVQVLINSRAHLPIALRSVLLFHISVDSEE